MAALAEQAPVTPLMAVHTGFDDELKGVVEDVEKLLTDSEDTERVERCLQLSAEVERCLSDVEGDARKIIENMSQQVEEAQNKADQLAEKTPSSPEIEALVNERQALENSLRNKTLEKEAALKLVAELEAKVEALEAEDATSAARAREHELPAMAYQIQLYSNVSGIKWDWDACTKTKIGGCVVNTRGGVAKNFSISLEDKRASQVADQLWSLVGGAC